MGSYRPLHDGWTVAPADSSLGPVPATVPGCVHTDLLAAGRIPDPYLDDNETALRWVGHADWVYETAFRWDGAGGPRVDLVCAGLDTVAAVTLNGVELGSTANMHRGYRFDARPHLRSGDNRLRIRFDSAYRYAEALRERLGDRPNAYPDPFNFVRKMACNFGWDWGPNVATVGIWQPIGLHTWDIARLASVRPLVTVDDGAGRVDVHVRVERASDEPLTVSAAVAGSRAEVTIAPGERTAVVTLEVRDPALWWPRGYGDQARHLLDVTLRSAGGSALDIWQRRIGFRSVRLDTAPDAHGSAFTVVVNDVPVFVRGVNWIPDDTFVTRVTRERYAERLGQACEANVNLLRVWGGGRYESDDFYDRADELGLLVVQDFLFACAAYPEEEPIAGEVAAEAREQVVRLASHPSLVAWFGNNENNWGWHDWGWQARLGGRTWGEGYYLDVLPRIVAELDPTRPYWPSSPWSGRPDIHPNDPARGSMHIWDVWNERDYVHYRDHRPRFVAEFGYQGPPAFATLRRAIGDEPLAHDSPGMRHHQKATDGDAKLQRGLDAHLPAPRDFDDWHYLTQVNQARAVALGVEHFRSLRPLCMGAIAWQLNDCWPVTSWAAIDGDGRRKPMWYALRRAYADRLLTIQPRDGDLVLVAVNDSAEPWTAPASVTRRALSGEPRAKTAVELDVPPRSAVTLPLPRDVTASDDPRRELLVAEADPVRAWADAGSARAWWFFAEDKDIAYPAPEYDATAEPTPEGWRVTVHAGTILRDLALFPDRLDPSASVDDLLVTLLPGESATFTVRGPLDLDPAALTTRPVLRCVNDIPLPVTGPVLAVDVGGTKLAAAVVEPDGTIRARARVATPSGVGGEKVAAALDRLVREVAANGPAARLVGLGVGSAGPLDLAAGTVSPVNIPDWRPYPIVDALRPVLPGRPTVLAGDGHCMALGEYWRGGYTTRAMLGMVVSTGVGGGLVLDGRIYPGVTGNAGHIGHIVVDIDGPPCACGGRGCVEAIASGPSMARWARAQGWAPAGPADARTLARDARDGDPVARRAFRRSATALAAGIVCASGLIDLDDVVVGGGVAGAGDLLFAPLHEAIADLAGLAFIRRVRIHPSPLGGDAGLLGAAALALDAASPRS